MYGHNLVTFQLSPALSGYDDVRTVSFYRALLDNIRALPGVKSAAYTVVPVLSGDEWDSTMSVEGHRDVDGEDMQAFMNSPSPGYFQTMGTTLLEGRDFRESDQKDWGFGHDDKVVVWGQSGRSEPEICGALLQGGQCDRPESRLWQWTGHQAGYRNHRRGGRLSLRRPA